MSVYFYAAILLSCRKLHNIPPKADNESFALVDVSWATLSLLDLEQQAAFLGEQQPLNKFYINLPEVMMPPQPQVRLLS